MWRAGFMKCPFCFYEESKVIDSRPTDEGEESDGAENA